MKNQHELKEMLGLIEQRIKPGTVIPKPQARGKFVVKGWGRRRNERAIVYNIPNHSNPSRPYQKGIIMSEWKMVSSQLFRAGEFTSKWS